MSDEASGFWFGVFITTMVVAIVSTIAIMASYSAFRADLKRGWFIRDGTVYTVTARPLDDVVRK